MFSWYSFSVLIFVACAATSAVPQRCARAAAGRVFGLLYGTDVIVSVCFTVALTTCFTGTDPKIRHAVRRELAAMTPRCHAALCSVAAVISVKLFDILQMFVSRVVAAPCCFRRQHSFFLEGCIWVLLIFVGPVFYLESDCSQLFTIFRHLRWRLRSRGRR